MSLRLVPKNRTGDKFIAYIKFIKRHKRLPNKNFLNDYLFTIKTTDEILDVLRQYTSDKELVKNYIRDAVGDDLNVKTKAILRTVDEVQKYRFVAGDVVKPTHASGKVFFVKDNEPDKEAFLDWLKIDYYHKKREANYRYLTPKIIVEEPIFGRHDVDDIKFFCVKGKVKVVYWDFDRFENHTRLLYDRNWQSLDAGLEFPMSPKFKAKPKKLSEMIEVAERLAKPFSLVRVDLFYDEKTEEYCVGEITHCHSSSNGKFDSRESEIRVSKVLFG